MKILVDTREQTPLIFNHEWITEVERKKLNYGDYACQFIDGHIPKVVFERKSIPDLFGTMGKGYKRFKKEVERAKDDKCNLIIIIEGTLTEVSYGTEYSTIEGSSIIKKMFTLWVRHGLFPVFCRDSKEASDYITNFYIAIGNEYIKNK